MLILGRHEREKVRINIGDITVMVTVVKIKDGRSVKLGFEAPKEVGIARHELPPRRVIT